MGPTLQNIAGKEHKDALHRGVGERGLCSMSDACMGWKESSTSSSLSAALQVVTIISLRDRRLKNIESHAQQEGTTRGLTRRTGRGNRSAPLTITSNFGAPLRASIAKPAALGCPHGPPPLSTASNRPAAPLTMPAPRASASKLVGSRRSAGSGSRDSGTTAAEEGEDSL